MITIIGTAVTGQTVYKIDGIGFWTSPSHISIDRRVTPGEYTLRHVLMTDSSEFIIANRENFLSKLKLLLEGLDRELGLWIHYSYLAFKDPAFFESNGSFYVSKPACLSDGKPSFTEVKTLQEAEELSVEYGKRGREAMKMTVEDALTFHRTCPALK